MTERDAFLRWSHPDLLDERLLQGCAIWQVMAALSLPPDMHPSPRQAGPSVLTWSGRQWSISCARECPPKPPSFVLGPAAADIHVFCLLNKAMPVADLDPLDSRQWLFWVVAASSLNANRRSIGCQPLMRAHGDGLTFAALAAAMTHCL
jgi:hypothetical protein